MPLPSPNFSEACERVRCLSVLYGLSTTSGGRTDQRNQQVGGHANSWHRHDRGAIAWDLVPDGTGEEAEAQLMDAAHAARQLGFDAIVYSAHLHVEPRG